MNNQDQNQQQENNQGQPGSTSPTTSQQQNQSGSGQEQPGNEQDMGKSGQGEQYAQENGNEFDQTASYSSNEAGSNFGDMSSQQRGSDADYASTSGAPSDFNNDEPEAGEFDDEEESSLDQDERSGGSSL